ncbi:CBS domain-containing protein, partial [candidate division WOR-3 bacterium]|nr:CBS domain-containing protein [candidate division WOR-3 bacterium]MBD3364857.1 CBS domain-containing protein [candidate division WOR-3 bacterium]
RRGEKLSITRLDLLTALRLGERIGSIEGKTSPRVANLFRAFDIPLAEVMTPWDRVVTLHDRASHKRILKAIDEHSYTRYPVVDKKTGKLKGILHTKDLLMPRRKLRKPFFTKPGVRITELLKTMQSNRAHMAIILNRSGDPTGLVTLEDLLEEFIGEIRSEE